MQKYRLFGFVLLATLIVMILSGCNSIGKRYKTLDDNIANTKIYENGIKLSDAMGYINYSWEMLEEDNIELIAGGEGDGFYLGYVNNELGLYLISYRTGGVKYIELDSDKFSLQGINKNSNFKDVKKVFGYNLVNVVEDALPGLRRYELVYKFNDNFFKVYAFDEKGNSGLYFCITDEFESKYGYMEITPDDINDYFEMTKESIIEKLGKGDEPFSNRLRYENYGILFKFNTEDTKPYQIYLSDIYQFNGLRQIMPEEKTTDIMGDGVRTEHQTSEDGPLIIHKYEYERFIFKVYYLVMESELPSWDITRK